MDKKEKIALVYGFTNNIRNKIVELIDKDKIPESWNGVELKQLLSDIFLKETFFGENNTYTKRCRRYKLYKYYVKNKLWL